MTHPYKAMKNTSLVAVFLILSGLTGCDRISSWYESVTQKDTKKTAPAPAAATKAAPVDPTAVNAELPPGVIARIGKWTLTVDEFNERLTKLKDILPEFDPNNTNSKKLILEELVRQQLLVMDAEQSGLAQRKDLVDTVEDFRKTLLVQELATELTKDIEATEADAFEYYEKNKKEFVEKAEWKVREIVVGDEGQAKEILVQLLQGADFAETAKARSKGPTADKGGDKGYVTKFAFDQMQNAVATLDTGKVSSVFKGPDGFYIVKLDDKKGGQPKPFAAVKTELVKGLTLRKQQEAVLEYLGKLAGKNRIEVNEDLLK
jgi:peptidyl-prolyl cis-trans isomerase C